MLDKCLIILLVYDAYIVKCILSDQEAYGQLYMHGEYHKRLHRTSVPKCPNAFCGFPNAAYKCHLGSIWKHSSSFKCGVQKYDIVSTRTAIQESSYSFRLVFEEAQKVKRKLQPPFRYFLLEKSSNHNYYYYYSMTGKPHDMWSEENVNQCFFCYYNQASTISLPCS